MLFLTSRYACELIRKFYIKMRIYLTRKFHYFHLVVSDFINDSGHFNVG